MTEFDWIARHFAALADKHAALGLRDDAALLDIAPAHQLVVTTDTINESVHFLPDTPAHLIAQKALRVNLSDLAAMGAAPTHYTLNMSLPHTTGEQWISDFCDGLRDAQREYAIALIGGDTTATFGPLSITITAFGVVPTGTALTRSGAQHGDGVFVTGTIGDATIGLQQLQQHGSDFAHCINRYHLPQPRVQLAQSLRTIATACMDISDGLAQDIHHICRASSCGAVLHAARVPLSRDAQQWLQHNTHDIATLISGGDDYELLFSAPAKHQNMLHTLAQQFAIPITAIGTITDDENSVSLVDEHGNPLTLHQKGYQHF